MGHVGRWALPQWRDLDWNRSAPARALPQLNQSSLPCQSLAARWPGAGCSAAACQALAAQVARLSKVWVLAHLQGQRPARRAGEGRWKGCVCTVRSASVEAELSGTPRSKRNGADSLPCRLQPRRWRSSPSRCSADALLWPPNQSAQPLQVRMCPGARSSTRLMRRFHSVESTPVVPCPFALTVVPCRAVHLCLRSCRNAYMHKGKWVQMQRKSEHDYIQMVSSFGRQQLAGMQSAVPERRTVQRQVIPSLLPPFLAVLLPVPRARAILWLAHHSLQTCPLRASTPILTFAPPAPLSPVDVCSHARAAPDVPLGHGGHTSGGFYDTYCHNYYDPAKCALRKDHSLPPLSPRTSHICTSTYTCTGSEQYAHPSPTLLLCVCARACRVHVSVRVCCGRGGRVCVCVCVGGGGGGGEGGWGGGGERG